MLDDRLLHGLLDSRRIGLRHFLRLFFLCMWERLDSVSFVKVEDGIELVGYARHEIVTQSLRLGAVDYANGALKPVGTELRGQAVISSENREKAWNSSLMKQIFI